MLFIKYFRPAVVLVAASVVWSAGLLGVRAQTAQVRDWHQALQRLQGFQDKELSENKNALMEIRRGIEFWRQAHPDAEIVLTPAPPEPWDAAAMRKQAALLREAVEAILKAGFDKPFHLKPATIYVEGDFQEDRFSGPLFTETNTKTRVTGNALDSLNPESRMSSLRALSLLPSVNQQSVDPLGLADSSNYHESFRFRGVEATGGGNPSTPVNVENMPVSGRPGGGANIYDLENFRSISIYKGGIPADKAVGLTNIGGKIDMEVKRPEESLLRFEASQSFGSYGFRRTFARISSGSLASGTAMFLSYSSAHAGKWKGEGDSDRNNAMIGLTQTVAGRLKVEAFSVYNQVSVHSYRPLNYAQISSLNTNYDDDYSKNRAEYHYFDYNKNAFTDYNIFGNIEYRFSGGSNIVVKPFYWNDKGYYQETIVPSGGGNRIRKWNMDHSIKGATAQYLRPLHGGYLSAGYSYINQERPGPPTSWKLYTASAAGLAFDKWQLLSNASRHEQQVPFVSGKYALGSLALEGSVKFMHYAMPAITTYVTAGIPDISAEKARATKPAVETGASVKEKNFDKMLATIGVSYKMRKPLSAYFSYGRNHGLSVGLYQFFIAQKNSFYAKGIALQKLWDEQKLEIADNFDFGLRYGSGKLYVMPTYYFARHHNKTATYYDSSLNATFPSAVFDADAHGFELEAGALPLKNLSVYSSFSYNRFYFSQNIQNQAGEVIPVNGKQAPDAPKYMAKGSVSYSVHGFILSPSLRHVSSRYGDILQKEKVDGATLVDLDLAYSGAIPRLKTGRLKTALSFSNLLRNKYIGIINTSDYATLGSTYQAGAPLTVQGSVAVAF